MEPKRAQIMAVKTSARFNFCNPFFNSLQLPLTPFLGN